MSCSGPRCIISRCVVYCGRVACSSLSTGLVYWMGNGGPISNMTIRTTLSLVGSSRKSYSTRSILDQSLCVFLVHTPFFWICKRINHCSSVGVPHQLNYLLANLPTSGHRINGIFEDWRYTQKFCPLLELAAQPQHPFSMCAPLVVDVKHHWSLV